MESSPKGDAPSAETSVPIKPLTFAASIAALGVVFGDIGTSPLYALRESFKAAFLHSGPAAPSPVVPILSLIIWSLILVVTVKYVILVMAANDEGEGGVMTLVSLSSKTQEAENPDSPNKGRNAMVVIGLIAAGLLYGDGIITPAISVLSAMEGLKEANSRLQGSVIDPHLLSNVIPWLAIFVLIPLFVIQRKGTSKVGAYFGPITLAWFISIAGLGVLSLYENSSTIPALLHAFNPLNGFGLFFTTPGLAFVIIGAVFLAVTGAEALYADMGHFGEKPIRTTWHLVVLPALIVNYLGQGAWVMSHSADIQDPLFNPFFNMAPNWAQIPLVCLATCAAIIASQALISGAFSMTTQAIQLKYLPRMRIIHTSGEESGQVYLPFVNWFLFIGCAYAVLQFRSSEALAGAYGIAVSLTMLATTLLYAEFLRKRKHLGAGAYILMIPFILLELLFIAGNFPKILQGGWLPLLVGGFVFICMYVWNRGRTLLQRKFKEGDQKQIFDVFMDSMEDSFHKGALKRVPGVAVYMVGNTESVPMALAHNLKHNKVVHEHLMILTIKIDEYRATVPAAERVNLIYRVPNPAEKDSKATDPFPRVIKVIGNYGFRENGQIEPVLRAAFEDQQIEYNMMKITYFVSRETVVRKESHVPGLSLPNVEEKIFEVLNRNSLSATAYFNLPPGRVVELGMQVEM